MATDGEPLAIGEVTRRRWRFPPVRVFFLGSLLIAAPCSGGQAANQHSEPESRGTLGKGSPKITLIGRVSDHADLLSSSQEKALAAQLESLELQTQHQLVVVSVESLGGENIAHFTQDLGNAWGVGRAGHNDGVILLIAPNERQVRIAVGYGLEDRLPDAFCKQIF